MNFIEEEFMYELDKTWDTGNILFAQNVIKKYNGIISQEYILNAKNIINEVIIEKIEDIKIS